MTTPAGSAPSPERAVQLEACRHAALEAAYKTLPGITAWELFLVFASSAASIAKRIKLTRSAFRKTSERFFDSASVGPS